MAIKFHCSCGKTLVVKDEAAGKRVKCPACGQVCQIPAGEGPPAVKDRARSEDVPAAQASVLSVVPLAPAMTDVAPAPLAHVSESTEIARHSAHTVGTARTLSRSILWACLLVPAAILVLGVAFGLLESFLVADETLTAITQPSPNGNAVVRGQAGPSDIVITTTNRVAGAIHSLTWNGKEFIDSTDHGRQLQSAASFNCAKMGEFCPECYNPTEAGSRADGAGSKSSSKLLRLRAEGSELETVTQMAFWLAPGEASSDHPALNDTPLSRHILKKRVRAGYEDLPHVLDYEVVFTVPPGERHTYAQFEALTGYMPAEFGSFYKFNARSGKLHELDDGPGEQSWPVVFTTQSGGHAMGVFSPDQPSPGYEEAGYGRFRFGSEKVVKWNCVFRLCQAMGIAAGDYRFRVFVAVGTLEDVRQSLDRLVKKFQFAR
jgi:hypothetical protein